MHEVDGYQENPEISITCSSPTSPTSPTGPTSPTSPTGPTSPTSPTQNSFNLASRGSTVVDGNHYGNQES
jgi:hypothetical protein